MTMLLVAALPVLAAAQENAFRSNWQPHLQAATADEAVNVTRPTHCKLAVVGAGWGGAYLAWRLAVDTTTVNASDVCVFEANGRVGGRIFSVHARFSATRTRGAAERTCDTVGSSPLAARTTGP
jgi:hypothetical protein